MSELRKIRRALVSVSDKEGIADFAGKLAEMGVEIVSTGGTAKALKEAGVDVKEVSDLTGFPEMMDGRVKTLHPKVHGALLAVRDNESHRSAMEEHGIEPIDMVVINLYPFESTIEKEGVTVAEAVEQIDIGGPAMIRSASKNWRDVAVVTDSGLYPHLIEELEENDGSLSLETRRRLAALSFTLTSYYDLAISSYLADQLGNDDLDFLEPFNPFGNLAFIEIDEEDAGIASETEETDHDAPESEGLPSQIGIGLVKSADLRYGENPHQRAATYSSGLTGGIANAEQLQGKEMSYNNYVDAEAAWRLVQDFGERAVAIIKHTNPSGVGFGGDNLTAYKRALATDPVSAFGGIVAVNREVDEEVAKEISKIFTEVVVAPSYTQEAVEAFKKKKNVRVLTVSAEEPAELSEYRQISGGFLVQDRDIKTVTLADLKVASDRQPTEEEYRSLLFAWTVCKHVKSNAIVLANQFQTVGVGAGQMNRVDSVRIAAMRAERTDLEIKGSVLASDAFFPFRDNVDEAAKIGVSAIIQPGGSMRDDESIQAANEHGIAMVFTGFRHFKH
ncbi:MAG: bifunctional phosphoribosylaminoimidazolecarboxamide formyltransferase/IMP cyclohydrolase PurH [Acidobacteria bacterium]|nr:MAG: bifunctional phosphoribosylaminoimidazolecarboxamide formyltransferase/IMP cyclohydrolase PurH [Acidobacteriota bacterium]REK02658.1 MAG: bifunctional phosphoribosylaminoimidazolecarboxamide formyltransferase/IMP cyclohydrolase PurH [Acidobacteriota bacterium]REK13538.1 MAG: bifunctional phosphoribosylaminoimidazolecarboxamide formyltransferase/IMP cyclohydrolase PurH [Acidobacteriota bacterium]REK41532.1 MAG: bifunctional phosphoribosylaminoimidazolecarboxamide formyltransferase/IMP cyc